MNDMSRTDLELFENDDLKDILNLTEEDLESERTKPKPTLLDIFLEIICNKLFILLLMSITAMYFIIGGVLYWSPTYMVDIFQTDKN